MPTVGLFGEPHPWKRQKAWTRHYMAKGCSEFKAGTLARKKVARKRTWPPET